MAHFNSIENKIFEFDQLKNISKSWKENNECIVFTNGCFDLLHLGHITYLSQAADLGTKLIIGVNSDSSVKRLEKGSSRPIKQEDTRLAILASLAFVDGVVVFDEDTPLRLINEIQPNILVKGGDYDPLEVDETSKKYIVGSKEIKNWNGKTQILEFLPGHSTTALEQKILNSK